MDQGYSHFFLPEQLLHGLDEAVGESGPGTWTWTWLGGAGRNPRVLLRTKLLTALLPCLASLSPQLSLPTHSLAQATHLMGSSWRELVNLGWQDTQRNLVRVWDLVTVTDCRNRMSISPGDPRGCERPKASRGISLQGWEEAEAGAGPGKSLS